MPCSYQRSREEPRRVPPSVVVHRIVEGVMVFWIGSTTVGDEASGHVDMLGRGIAGVDGVAVVQAVLAQVSLESRDILATALLSCGV